MIRTLKFEPTLKRCNNNFLYLFQLVLLLEVCSHMCESQPDYPGDNAPVEELVTYYFRQFYTANEICGFLLLCHNIVLSHSSLKRILRRLQLKRRNCEARVAEVVNEVLRLQRNGYRNMGYRSLWRVLNVCSGIRVTQTTVRTILNVVDPNGVELRSCHRLRRRLYFNRGPNYLLHIDGYDKLKPYGIAIHGAVDGFSRKIVWLEAGPSNNNPEYVARFYLDYVKRRGTVPLCIRMDAGTENVIIKDIQSTFRVCADVNTPIPPFIEGSSTNNQRIERLWGSLRLHVIDFWRDLFRDMRDSGLFSEADPVHIESIRFCFLPTIQKQLEMFTQIWNTHRIRSQRHLEVPSGIPNILFHQPEVFNSHDYSFEVPCSVEMLDQIMREYSAEFPEFGCSHDFVEMLEILSGLDSAQFLRPSSINESVSLFNSIVEVINDY